MRRNILIFSTLFALLFFYGCASDKVEPANEKPANFSLIKNDNFLIRSCVLIIVVDTLRIFGIKVK